MNIVSNTINKKEERNCCERNYAADFDNQYVNMGIKSCSIVKQIKTVCNKGYNPLLGLVF